MSDTIVIRPDQNVRPKDPNEKIVYTFDWSRLLPDGAAITASVFSISDVGDGELALDNDDFDATTTSVRVTGGTVGQRYRITCHITTDETPTQEFERSFYVPLADR